MGGFLHDKKGATGYGAGMVLLLLTFGFGFAVGLAALLMDQGD
jgi:hypothetical protein